VPPAREISTGERAVIDRWLEKFLVESQSVERTRDELNLLRWRRDDDAVDEDQNSLLREMGLALLEEMPLMRFRDVVTQEEAEMREAMLAMLVSERRRKGILLPWQMESERLQLGEALASVASTRVDFDRISQMSANPPRPSEFGGSTCVDLAQRLRRARSLLLQPWRP
jgi:hypothetical protein